MPNLNVYVAGLHLFHVFLGFLLALTNGSITPGFGIIAMLYWKVIGTS